jgi:hypothetical protein
LINNRFPIPFRVDMTNVWPIEKLGNRVFDDLKEVLAKSWLFIVIPVGGVKEFFVNYGRPLQEDPCAGPRHPQRPGVAQARRGDEAGQLRKAIAMDIINESPISPRQKKRKKC